MVIAHSVTSPRLVTRTVKRTDKDHIQSFMAALESSPKGPRVTVYLSLTQNIINQAILYMGGLVAMAT